MNKLPPMILVLIIWCAGLGAAAQFGKISVLYDDLRAIYGANGEAGLGLIVSVVGTVGLILGTTAGLLVARIGPKRAIVIAMILGAMVSAVQALMPAFPVMIATRILEGFSHLTIVVVGPTMIASLAPPEKRALAMTLWASFFGVAYALLALIAPWLTGFGGASGLFLFHAGWMAVLAMVLIWALPKDPKTAVAPLGNILAKHLAIYRSPRIAAPALGFCFYTFLYVALMTLLPPAAPESVRAVMATGMPLISIAVSLTLGVWMLRFISAVTLVQWGYLAAIPGAAILALFWGQPAGMLIGGLWIASALGIAQGASFAAIPELNAKGEDQAAAAGAVAQMGNVGTTFGTPVLAAILVGAGPQVLMVTAILCCLAGILVHALQSKRRKAALRA